MLGQKHELLEMCELLELDLELKSQKLTRSCTLRGCASTAPQRSPPTRVCQCLRDCVVRRDLDVHKLSFSISLLFLLRLQLDEDTQPNRQKCESRTTDVSETLRLDVDGVVVAEEHDRVAESVCPPVLASHRRVCGENGANDLPFRAQRTSRAPHHVVYNLTCLLHEDSGGGRELVSLAPLIRTCEIQPLHHHLPLKRCPAKRSTKQSFDGSSNSSGWNGIVQIIP